MYISSLISRISVLVLLVVFVGQGDSVEVSTRENPTGRTEVVDLKVDEVTEGAPEDETTTETESTSDWTTDAAPTETTTSLQEVEEPPKEEPKLPIDLLSSDILLDPNIVLARVARGLDYFQRSPERDYHRRPLRRTDQETRNRYREDQNYRRRLPIYPVFPGRK